MKKKIKNAIGVIILILIIAFVTLSYPFKVKVINGKTVCSNAFNKVVKCR